MQNNKYVCVHGHFYQPPRENPWLERIELQDSAYPYHDWNERITAECYEPNTSSRILSDEQEIIRIVNNYSKMSFNFGPTLLSWLEEHSPTVYAAIIEADKLSMKNFSGHGSALAQVYNHIIMPLANERDKRTQVIWGIRDFESRFGRKPEGMWLAETAVNTETLEILAEYGLLFTILAPNQASHFKKSGDKEWVDLQGHEIDPRRPYLYKLPSGKSITLFFYDGPVSNSLAFQGLLSNGKNYAERLLDVFDNENDHPQLAHVATDGESYGHHHRHGDMALAYALNYIEEHQEADITIYGEYLEKFPPEYEVKIKESTAWSCAHGVERWNSNCGCRASGDPSISQEWRHPLREALDWLRDKIAVIYEIESEGLLMKPWMARNDYIKVILDRSEGNANAFFTDHAIKNLTREERVKIRKLLEMQRHAMLMYTSCGWFFDDISGIETVQIIQYAGRVIQLGEEFSNVRLEEGFLNILQNARSNFPKYGDGRTIYERWIKPGIIDLLRVGAHYAISSLFLDYPENTTISAYNATSKAFMRREAGEQKIVIGKALIHSEITEEEKFLSFAVLHLGGHNIAGGIRKFTEEHNYNAMLNEIKEAFVKSDLVHIIHLIDKHFDSHNYSFWHLFKDEQRNLINQLLSERFEEISASFRSIFNNNYGLMKVLNDFDIPMPSAFAVSGEFILNNDFVNNLEAEQLDMKEIKRISREFNDFSLKPESTISFNMNKKINNLMQHVYDHPMKIEDIKVLDRLLAIGRQLHLDLDLWKVQNTYFLLWKNKFPEINLKAKAGDKDAERWLGYFYNLGRYLHIKIDESVMEENN